MKYRVISFCVVLFLIGPLNAHAIRHVGSGGGDAENKILEMMELFPVWLDALDLQGPELTVSQKKLLSSLKVQFVNPENNKGSVLYIPSDSLYESDHFTTKSEEDLVILLGAAISKKIQVQIPLSAPIAFSPLGKGLPWGGAVVFKGLRSDFLFSRNSKKNLNLELSQKMACSSYRYLSETFEGSLFYCLDSKNTYVALAVEQDEDLSLEVRFYSEE